MFASLVLASLLASPLFAEHFSEAFFAKPSGELASVRIGDARRPRSLSHTAIRYPGLPMSRMATRFSYASSISSPTPDWSGAASTANIDRAGVSQQWVQRLEGLGATAGTALAPGPEDSVFVAGFGGVPTQCITGRYASNGELLWQDRYPAPDPTRPNACLDAVSDSAGNLYAGGYIGGYLSFREFLLMRYGPDGKKVWALTLSGVALGGYGNAWITALAIDDDGAVYAVGPAGSPFPSEAGYHFLTMKVEPSGEIAWLARYEGVTPHGWGSEPSSIAIDSLHNVYVTGGSPASFEECCSTDALDFLTVKYDSNGLELWARRHSGTGGGYDFSTAIDVDTDGNAYVTGISTNDRGATDYLTIKYDGTGREVWAARYDGGSGDGAFDLAVDSRGHTYVTGGSWGGNRDEGGSQFDIATVKYNQVGESEWVRRYGLPGNWSEWGQAIAVDSLGDAYVTGGGWGSDYATIKYSSAGELLWEMVYGDPANNSDLPYALLIDCEGMVFVTGTSYGAMGFGAATIKYDQGGGSGGRQCVGPCKPSSEVACLLDGRFEIKVDWRTADANGSANAMSFGGQRAESDESVFMWFFGPQNFEMGIKMVDACVPPFDSFWAFQSGLTNQGYTVRIRDTITGSIKTYSNPLGSLPTTTADTNAFSCMGAGESLQHPVARAAIAGNGALLSSRDLQPNSRPTFGDDPTSRYSSASDRSAGARSGEAASCTNASEVGCLLGERFEVRVDWESSDATGTGKVMSFGGARAQTDESVFMWFFSPFNFEMAVKMVDACLPPFGKFWVFQGGLTNQGYTVTVRDTVTGATRVYKNELGALPTTTADTSAFDCP